jgi:hypothetical protein
MAGRGFCVERVGSNALFDWKGRSDASARETHVGCLVVTKMPGDNGSVNVIVARILKFLDALWSSSHSIANGDAGGGEGLGE